MKHKEKEKRNVKKVLIIACYYPPSKEMAAVRPYEFVKYLPKNGWEPIVLTGTKGKNRQGVIYVPVPRPLLTQIKDRRLKEGKKGLLTNALRIFNKLFMYIDDDQLWRHSVKKKAEDIIQKEHIDIVFITCMPFSTALIGPYIKDKTGTPYILDFRDAWTLNPYRISLPGQGWIHEILEHKALSHAKALITTTPTTSSRYREKYPFLDVHTVYNGYDPELFNKIGDQKTVRYNKFTITYLGSLDYNRKPDMILNAIKDLVKEKKIGKDFQLNICGRILANYTHEMIDRFGLKKYIKFNGCLPREKAILELKKSHASLLIQGDTGKKYCLPIAGKTFEYFKIGNPIICIAPDGDNSRLIRE
jgi:glycosyltransferase involved in cell wall biosynthesis